MKQDSALAQAESLLLTPFSLTEGDLSRTFGPILPNHVYYADLYFQYSRSEAWSLDEGIVKSGSFNIDQGVGVRAIAAAGHEGALAAPGFGQFSRSTVNAGLYLPHDPLASLPAEAKVSLLERLESFARALDPRVIQVMASLAGEYEVMLVAGSDGRLAADIRPLVRCSISVIVEENGKREQGASGGGGRFDFGYFDDEVLQRYAKEAVHQATVNLHAEPAPAGQMTVVLGSGWPGILLHAAVGHGLEGDFNRKGSSAFSGRIGQRVAAKGVTVLDDGTINDRRGSLNVDDEGHATQRNVLIEDGILRAYMQDSLNARLMGVKPTGNGGGEVDITSGKFVFSASEAYWVENGKVLYPVKGATIVGNGPDALTRVSLIGNDMRLDSGVGTCGKEGQSVPVGVGQPTLRIDGLTVGGTA